MDDSFPNAEANYKTIEKLLLEPENKKCADCTGSSSDGYICLDFGTFVCFHCAEILRSHQHKVKKIAPNNIRDEDLEVVKANGNRKSYDKWLVRYTGDHPEPNNTKDRAYRAEYLRLKYDEKKWARHDAAPLVVDYDDNSSSRNRSTSSPPAFANPPNPFTYAAPSPAQVQMMQQQQLQQQLLANQQHLQQQQMQQQMLQQQLHQQQAILQHQLLQQQQQQYMLQQQQFVPQVPTVPQIPQPQIPLPYQQPQVSPRGPLFENQISPRGPLMESLSQSQLSEVRTRSPSTGSLREASLSGARSPPNVTPITPPVLSARGASPLPNGYNSSGGSASPTTVSSPSDVTRSFSGAGRQRSSSKIGVCPQCGAGVDSREMGKHKLKECPYRTASAQ